MKISRRPVFFALLAVICLALVPATTPEFRWVNFSMAVLAAFWAILLAIEEMAAQRRGRE